MAALRTPKLQLAPPCTTVSTSSIHLTIEVALQIRADLTGPSLTRLVSSAAGAVAFLGLCLGAIGMTVYEPLAPYPWKLLTYGAGFGGLLMLLLVGAALAFKRFVMPAFPLRALLSPLPLSMFLLGLGTMAALNGILGSRELQEYETVVVKKEQRDGKDGAAWFKVKDFRPGHRDELLPLSPHELFHEVNEGDRIVVVVGRGLVEWWLEGVHLAEPNPRPTPPSTP